MPRAQDGRLGRSSYAEDEELLDDEEDYRRQEADLPRDRRRPPTYLASTQELRTWLGGMRCKPFRYQRGLSSRALCNTQCDPSKACLGV